MKLTELIEHIEELRKCFGDITLSELIKKLNIELLKKQNKYFVCKSCSGTGNVKINHGITKIICSEEEAIVNAGYSGSFSPVYFYKEVPNIRTEICKYCKGNGYTESPLVPITETIVVGYKTND